jgi:trigger factor
MKVEMTELGPVKRAIRIEVPEEEVKERFRRAYAELNRQVQVPGFRPGKAPVSLLERRYAKTVEEDVIRTLVPEYYDRAVRQTGIHPVVVDIPPIDRVKIKKDASFAFTATVEIRPKIELRDYRPPNPISLKPDKRTVTDEQIEKALDVLREQQAQLQPTPPGVSLKEGDFAVLDIEGFLDQQPLDGTKKQGHLHRIGSKLPVLGLEIDQHLTGQVEGAHIDIPQSYPATHPDQRVAGKTVTFRISIVSAKHKTLPALDDEFAKDCGPYNSLDELKDKLRDQMEKALKRDIEDGYKEQIMKRLVETHHFELPQVLVDREVTAIVRSQLHARHQKRGGEDEPDEQALRPEELKKLQEEALPEASRRVKLGLILDVVAEKEGLTVEEADLQAEIARMATELKIDPQELQRIILAGGSDSRDELRSRILADKALDFVYRHAVIQG